ncbi:MAG: AAA family ATPase [Archangium sp.]|nr:AAA family ATPase [Archangium sp.]
MKLSKLQVENFKAIASAELEFGPGLNVLYGPNDLGKSTLGVAVRAALLLPSNSSAAADYVPWQEAVTPVVTLTFLTGVAKYWRVVKRFTENEATLSFSKDGREFSVDAHERQVDEKLRKLLGWGLATPGGRGGARGMPDSFLANALLAAQTDVDGILRSSLTDDADSSGKLRLTAALSALAQDPLVRHVLDAAQKEHELYFTATGRKKTGQNAPLTLASEQVKKLTDELMVQQQALSQSASLELEVRRLHDAWLEAQQQAELAEQSLARARAGLQRGTEKRAAEEKLATGRRALAGLEALAAKVKGLDEELAALGQQVQAKEAALQAAQQQVKTAAAALREAEEVLRKASSADGEAERAVARAALKEEQAKNSVSRAELGHRLDKAREARRAEGERARLGAELERLTASLVSAKAKRSEAEGQAALTGGIMNYGHWRNASEAARLAEQWRAEAQAARAEALKKTAEALGLQKSATTLDDELAARREALPDEKRRAALEKLRRDLELADAALGGGVTVVVRPKSTLLLRSTADENTPEEKKVMKEHSIEADRRVQLSIGDLVDIEVVVGAAEKRKDAEHLRKRWKAEALPALERAQVRTLAELTELFSGLSEQLERVKTQRQGAAQLEAEARSLRERSAMLDEKAAGAPNAAQLEDKKRAVGALPFDVLARGLEAMGPSWEREVREHHEATSAALAQASALVTKLEGEVALTGHRLADAKAQAPGPVDDVAALEQALAALEQALAKGAERLERLEQESTGAKKQAAAKLELAQQQLELAEAAVVSATGAVTAARAAQSGRQGERDATAAQLDAAEGPAVQARVDAATRHLATFADVEVLSAEELRQRERAVELARLAADQAGRDFANAEGALGKVGGPQAREQVRELEEAVMVAKAREHLLEVDAAAWRLLVEAVREAEKEDSSSLGSALAGPVTSRFAELTKGRYPTVKFDPSLTATGVEVPGAQSNPGDMLAALSVGTRDHLATLVRLAIALQLGSAIVLDDHLVHTDPARLGWFRDALRQAAQQTQVVVLTCRPLDYVPPEALPTGAASKTIDGDLTRVIDLSKVIKRR